MRKSTKLIASAFFAGISAAIVNTSTDGKTLSLHGSVIAKREGNKLFISLAGYNTTVTRERINGVLFVTGLPYSLGTEKGEPFIFNRLAGTKTPMPLTGFYCIGPAWGIN